MTGKSKEVAERSQDVEAKTSATHDKVFVLLKRQWDVSDKEEVHKANIIAARQALMVQGLRPKADGEFVGEEDHADGESVELTYSFPAEPARDEDPKVVEHHANPDDPDNKD